MTTPDLGQIEREFLASVAYVGASGVPVVGSLLCDAAGVARVCGASRVTAVLACDPGVQTGWALVAACDGVIVPVGAWVVGLRGERGVVSWAPGAADHAAMIAAVMEFCDGWMVQPTRVVCEDWFAGPNPNTARDIAKQFYFVEAAAECAGLGFRAVAHSTWKKTYLGRGNMKSADALMAYAAKGYAAHPAVARWGAVTASKPGLSDDAAALGLAVHYLLTERT